MSLGIMGMLASVWAAYNASRHFTIAMMYTRRLPLHPDAASIYGNFYSVVPLEVNLLDGCPLDRLLCSLQEQTDNRHLSGWRESQEALNSVVPKLDGHHYFP